MTSAALDNVCVNNLSKVALDSAAAGIEPATSSRKYYTHTMSILYTNTRPGDRAFPVAGPRLWNSLPSNPRQSDLTLHQFRRALKTNSFG